MNMLNAFKRPWVGVLAFGVAAVFMMVALPSMTASGADHLDAPLVAQDGRIDINDVYIFHPTGDDGMQDLDQTVLAMTVNPAAGVLSGTEFRKGATYDLLIDTDSDARSEILVRTRFGKPDDEGEQRVTTRWLQRGRRTHANGDTGEVFGRRGMSVFAGLRDDPFFLDFDNFNNGATFCGAGLPVSNFFQGFDVSAIVIQVPTSWMGDGAVGVWGRTGTGAFGMRPRFSCALVSESPMTKVNSGLRPVGCSADDGRMPMATPVRSSEEGE